MGKRAYGLLYNSGIVLQVFVLHVDYIRVVSVIYR